MTLVGCSAALVTEDVPHNKSIPKQAIERGESVDLENNLSQIRQFINMYRTDNDGKPPATLDELKRASKFPDSMFINPIDKKPLIYDPATGNIGVEGQVMSRQSRASTQNNTDPGAPVGANPAMPNINIPQPGASADGAAAE
jgi:hypothetical protein